MQLIQPSSLANDALECSRALETGNILFFPQVPFAFSAEHRDDLLSAVQSGSDLHKNVSYRPKQDKVSGLGDGDPKTADKVRASLRDFSKSAIEFVGNLLPNYRANWRLDYASFRGIEEAGRDLPWKKRNDLLHTDAFPTRPTNGDLILRFFANISPEKERVWVTSDPFEKAAEQFAVEAGLNHISGQAHSPLRVVRRAAKAVGLPVVDRSPYDEFMLRFHDFLKKNDDYQRNCPKYRFHFPANSAWMVFTDVVPHAVLSGQYAVEQTFLIAKESLASRERSPLQVLERLSGQRLSD